MEPGPILGSADGLTWRRSSANDGPGSILGENSGNALGSDIERGAYSRNSATQRARSFPHNGIELVIAGEVSSRSYNSFFIVIELAQRDVATEAQNAAYATGFVVVVDVVDVRLAADRAAASLRCEESVEVFEREPVVPLEVTLAVGDLLLSRGSKAIHCRSNSFRVLSLPLCRAFDRRARILPILQRANCKIAGLALKPVPIARARRGIEIAKRFLFRADSASLHAMNLRAR
jgi:hypothetical protein